MIRLIRKIINPPYTTNNILGIMGAVLILVAIPFTVLYSLQSRSLGGRAQDLSKAGAIKIWKNANSSFDEYAADSSKHAIINSRYQGMLVYEPHSDDYLAWYIGDALFYKDAYTIKTDPAKRKDGAIDSWILRDASGDPCYIPWGTPPYDQYAGDVGSEAFKSNWINYAVDKLNNFPGYAGINVDDVNLDDLSKTGISRVSCGDADPSGNNNLPIDPRTGTEMTGAAWNGYMASFMEEIRSAISGKLISHNTIWYITSFTNNDLLRQIGAADIIQMEQGFNDGGLKDGTGKYSWRRKMDFVDLVHANGAIVHDRDEGVSSDAEQEHGVANYFLLNNGEDYYDPVYKSSPDDPWDIYGVDLGAATGDRYLWNGVWRRNFDDGIVLVNPPEESSKTLTLGETYDDLYGAEFNSVTLGAKTGKVLKIQNNTQVLTFTPSADATIKRDNPNSNFGSVNSLEVDGSPVYDFLLKFNVTGVGSGSISSAMLRLHNINASSNGGSINVTDSSWTESNVTWNSAPVAGTTVVDSLGSVSPGNWYELDVGSVLNGDGLYSFRLISSSSDGADYFSKEGPFPPELVLTISDTGVDNTLNVQSEPPTGIVMGDGGVGKYNGITNYTKTSSSNISTWINAPGIDPSGYTFSNWTGCDSIWPGDDKWCRAELSGGVTQTVTAHYTTDTQSPSTPTNLSATAVSSSRVDLSWTASTDNIGVEGYWVIRDGVTIATTPGTIYQDNGVSPSITYSYQIIAYDEVNNLSTPSNTVTVTTPAVPDSQAPMVPTNLFATAVSSSQINLSWTASTDNVGVTGYEIYRKGSKIATVTTTSYGDGGLSSSTAYSYFVKARDAAGNVSGASSVVSATTQAVPTGGTLVGQVTSAMSGNPLVGATVTIRIAGSKGKSALVTTSTTNSSGVYAFSLDSGNYDIEVKVSGFRSQKKPITITSGTTSTVNFSLDSKSKGGKKK